MPRENISGTMEKRNTAHATPGPGGWIAMAARTAATAEWMVARVLPLVVALSCAWVLSIPGAWAAAQPSAPSPSESKTAAKVRRLMERGHVNGLAVALIEDGRVSRVEAYGRRSVERDLPLQTDTIMYGASLTKTAFAYMLLQLVDEKRLTLDTPLAELVPRPLPEYEAYKDLAGDERWRALTPRIVLTHTTGFANYRWLEDDKKLRFHWQPGTRYGYSGAGFYILQLAVGHGMAKHANRAESIQC